MSKIIHVYSKNLIDWQSCKSITKNLIDCYNSIKKNHPGDWLDIEIKQGSELEFYEISEKIIGSQADKIILSYYSPCQVALIKEVYERAKEANFKPLPQLFIHVYGDFTLYADKWQSINFELKQFSVKFICASLSQTNLLGKLLNDYSNITTIPFPVDTHFFLHSTNNRKSVRKELSLNDENFTFLYSGRISRQKSCIELISCFEEFYQETKHDVVLLLAGPFDDLGVPYLNRWDTYNQYYTEFQQTLDRFSEEIRDRIVYLGDLDEKTLLGIYNAADCYISLSRHNDEDFGMAPAEAAVTGLPLILTEWGGYKSFRLQDSLQCQLIPTSFEQKEISINKRNVTKAMFKVFAKRNQLLGERDKIANDYSNFLSKDTITKNIQSTMDQEVQRFNGFSSLMKALSVKTDFATQKFPFAKHITIYNDLYKDIYNEYK